MTVNVFPPTADGTSLFFGLWDEPRECEPAHGMLLRVAHLNGLPSTQLVAFQADIEGRNLRPDECLRLMLRHPMAGAADLALDTPGIVGKEVELRGHRFRKRDWSIKFRRHCPGCLAESAHHRNWWDLAFMTVCPFHGMPIAGGRGDAVPVGWSGTNMAWSRDHELAADVHHRLERPLRNLEAYVLGVMGAAPILRSPLLDGHAVADVVEAVRKLGALSLGGWSMRKPRMGRGRFGRADVLAAGFAIADAGAAGIAALLSSTRNGGPAAADDRAELGVSSMFGWAFSEFRRLPNPILKTVVDAMVEAAVSDGRIRRSRSLVADRSDAFGRMTMKEAAVATGIPRAAVPAMAAGHLPGFARDRRGSRVFLDARDVETIAGALDEVLTRSAAARRLGLPLAALRSLEAQGLLTPFALAQRNGFPSDRFRCRDVDGLIASALGRRRAKAPAGRTVTFGEQARILGVGVAELAARAVRGEIRAVGLSGGQTGFRELLFALPEKARVKRLKDRKRSRISRDGLTFAEAATHLGINQGTLVEAVRRRLIVAIDGSQTGTGFRRITEKALVAFEARYVASRMLAAPLGCHPSTVVRTLSQRDIRPAMPACEKAGSTAVFRRSTLPAALLEVIGTTVRDSSWESFARRINDAETSFRCPLSLLDGRARLRNIAGTVSVIVTVGEHGLALRTECDAARSPRRLAQLEERIRLLLAHPTIVVERTPGGATLVARLEGFDRSDAGSWAKAVPWVLAYLGTLEEVFSREASVQLTTRPRRH